MRARAPSTQRPDGERAERGPRDRRSRQGSLADGRSAAWRGPTRVERRETRRSASRGRAQVPGRRARRPRADPGGRAARAIPGDFRCRYFGPSRSLCRHRRRFASGCRLRGANTQHGWDADGHGQVCRAPWGWGRARHRSSDRHEGIGQSPWTPPARRAGGSRDGGQAPRLAGFRGAVVDPRAVRRQATENRHCPEPAAPSLAHRMPVA